MIKNPVLDLSLEQVLKPEIALILAQVHGIHTVGGFLRAYRNPRKSKQLLQAFDTPTQARHAAAVCSTWLGVRSPPLTAIPATWWTPDANTHASA